MLNKHFFICIFIIEELLRLPLELQGYPFHNYDTDIDNQHPEDPEGTKVVEYYGCDDLNRCGWFKVRKIVGRPQIKRKSVAACEKYKTIPNFNSRSLLMPFIEGGEDAYQAEYPHMVALGFYNSRTNLYQFDCGGSLISEKYIITAAHCIANIDENELKIARMGDIYVPPNTDKIDPVKDYKVRKVIVHPLYKRRKQTNDIALVQLENKVDFKINVRPACLQSSNEEPNNYEVTGWGNLKIDGERSPFLQKAYQTFVSRNKCSKKYVLYGKSIDETQICTYDDSSDTCPGDSGGPLQVRGPNIFTIVGITSFGAGCGGAIPGIYTRVFSYLDWIENIVWP